MAMQKTPKNVVVVVCVSKCSLVRDPAFELYFPATNETIRLVAAAVAAETALGALGLSDLDDVDGDGVELKDENLLG